MFEEIVKFYEIIGRLKKVKRTGWIKWIGIENPESVAEHTFRTAVIAMIASDVKRLDTGKMIRMALLHDISESIIGDWDYLETVESGKEKLKANKENKAMEKILSLLPKELKEKYSNIWFEYRDNKTKESGLVHQIDKLELLLQVLEYEKEGYDKNKLDIFWKNVKPLIENSDFKKIVELLEKERH